MTGPAPDRALAAADARVNARRIRNRLLRLAGLVVVLLTIPSLLASGHITAEWALAFGHASSIHDEGRGSALSGVILESLVVLGALLYLAILIRQALGLAAANRRWSQAPWLPGTSLPGHPLPRPVGQSVLFAPRADAVPWTAPDTLRLIIWPRPDGLLVTPGDQVWLAAPRRIRGRRRAPYALIRARDHTVFWAIGRPLPGQDG